MINKFTVFFSKVKVGNKGKNNKISGRVKALEKSRVIFRGSNNSLVIGDGVKLGSVSLNFSGDNAKIEFGSNCLVNGSFIVDSKCSIKIGGGTRFNNKNSRLHCGEPGTNITVGEGCLLSDVRIRTSDQHSLIDSMTGKRTNHAEDVSIGHDVWVAEDVYIYKGVNVGNGGVVGARSTVIKSLPCGALSLGSPAAPIKYGIAWKEEVMPVCDQTIL